MMRQVGRLGRAWLVALPGLVAGAAHPAFAASLRDAFEAAWQRTPDARALAAQRGVQEARRYAGGQLFPAAPFLQGEATSDRFLSNQGFNSYALEAGTPVWLPGEGTATIRQADAGLAELQARLAELRLAVAGAVRAAVGDVEVAAVALPPLERRAAAARDLAAATARRASRGESPAADALLSRSEAVTAEAALAEQRAALEVAAARFALLTGQATVPNLASDAAPPDQPARDHPRLLAARRAVATAEAGLRLAQATLRESPIVSLQGRTERQLYTEHYDTRLGLIVRLPLATEGRNRPRLAAAEAELTRAEASLAVAEREVLIEQRQARLGLGAAGQQLRLAEQAARLLAQRRVQLDQAYTVGEMPLVEVIRARSAAFEAELNRARAKAAQDRARSRLDQALGVLP